MIGKLSAFLKPRFLSCVSHSTEFLKFVGPKGADFRQVRQKPHTCRSYCLPKILLLLCM